MVYLLDANKHLVGVSHTCDYPPAAKRLPQLTRTLINSSADSQKIDDEVKRRLAQGLPLYEIDVDLLRALSPTIILAQSQCSVCAVDVNQAAALQLPNSIVFPHDAQSLEEMMGECARLAECLQQQGVAINFAALEELRVRSVMPQTHYGVKPRVLMIEWLDPLMSAGNWTPDLIERAGGVSLLAEKRSASPYIDWQRVLDADPDILIVAPCGFDLVRTRVDAKGLRELPGWSDLTAVKAHRVYLADGNGLFHSCGPRLIDSLDLLRAMVGQDETKMARFTGLAERWTDG